MELDIIEKMCSDLDFNTYSKIKRLLYLLFFTTLYMGDEVTQIFPAVNGFEVLAAKVGLGWLYFSWIIHKDSTKDIRQIKELYKIFLKNYNEMNKTFDLNNPIQIFTMYNYLLNNGYLSKDKKFEYGDENVRDIKSISGTNIFLGNSVCRHISTTLNDILNDYGIEAYNLGVYLGIPKIEFEVVDGASFDREQLLEWANCYLSDENIREVFIDTIKELSSDFDKGIKVKYGICDPDTFMFRFLSNHQISAVFQSGYSYFLDPTNDRIFRRIENDNKVLFSQDSDVSIRNGISDLAINNNLKKYLDFRKKLSLKQPSIDRESEIVLINDTKKICRDNIDIFEQFYNDNKEIYTEVSDMLIKIKK